MRTKHQLIETDNVKPLPIPQEKNSSQSKQKSTKMIVVITTTTHLKRYMMHTSDLNWKWPTRQKKKKTKQNNCICKINLKKNNKKPHYKATTAPNINKLMKINKYSFKKIIKKEGKETEEGNSVTEQQEKS